MNSKIKDLSLIALQSDFNRSLSVSYSGLQTEEVAICELIQIVFVSCCFIVRLG